MADLLVDFTSVAASAPGGSDATSSLFCLMRALYDANILACGDAPHDRQAFPLEKCAGKVPKLYLAAARDLDQKFHN